MPRQKREVNLLLLLAKHVMNTPLSLRLLRKFFKPKPQQRTVLKIVQVLGFADFLRNDSLLDLDCAPVWELTRMLLKQVVDH